MLPSRWPIARSLFAPAGLISGSDERAIQIASSTNNPAITMYGRCTLPAKALSRASRASGVGADSTCWPKVLMPLSTSAPNANGAIAPASLLQMPMKAMRWAALSIGPRMLMYGLEAVCSSDSPAPITNSPVSAPGYIRRVVNWPNSTAPIAITNRPSAMPFFMPVRRNTDDDGSARKKYDR